MRKEWISKAALYELLALAFLQPTQGLAETVASGEYAEALQEIAELNGLDVSTITEALGELATHEGAEPEGLFHKLRTEYTHLFVGAPKPAVSPFAGIWYAEEIGVELLLFVNKESMAVERFMRSCGIGQPEGTNEPLDHIGSELEFLQYLCLLRAEAAQPPEGVEVPDCAYEDFYKEHFSAWAKKFAAKTITESRLPFFKAVARVLLVLPETAL